MMKDRNNPEQTDVVAIHVMYEIYLKQRQEPVQVAATFAVNREHIRTETILEDFMQLATQHVLATVDVVSEHRIIFSDDHYNKFIFLTEEIQGISILAPTEETLLALVEG